MQKGIKAGRFSDLDMQSFDASQNVILDQK